jgi:dynein heavy chain
LQRLNYIRNLVSSSSKECELNSKQTALLHAEVKRDNNLRKFSKELDAFLGDIKRKLFEIKNSVADPAFLSVDSQPSVVLQRISWLTDDVTKLLNRARKYASYQQRFGVAASSAKKRRQAE